MEDTTNPCWPPCEISKHVLCHMNPENPLLIQAFSKDSETIVNIGNSTCTLQQMLQQNTFPLFNDKMRELRDEYVNSGELHVHIRESQQEPTEDLNGKFLVCMHTYLHFH